MSKLRKYYYDNKTKIWKTILIIVSLFAILYFINFLIRNQNQEILTSQEQNNIQNTVVDNTSLTTNQSVVGGTILDENKLEEDISIIEEFLNLCNNKEFEQAYELVSDDCKVNVFNNNYNDFVRTYCNKIFSTKKTYTSENWSGDIYKIRLVEDILATGQSSTSGTAIQEWYTVVEENDELKLNINNYIGEKVFNSTSNTVNDITIKILKSNTYKDYENYTIEVTNNTENTIYLDDGEDTSTIYIQDSNGVKHEAASSEIIFSTFVLPKGQTQRYTIKFTNSYISNREITQMVFDKIILNYEEYLKAKEDYSNTLSFIVDF